MSVDRNWKWTCDRCKLTLERSDYGLPKGWIFVKAIETTHRCPECKDEIPTGRQGIPIVTAER